MMPARGGKHEEESESRANFSSFESSAPGSTAQSKAEGGTSSSQTHSKPSHKTLDQLLIHNSDSSVKPIIGNRDIEKITDVTFKAQELPF